MNIDLTKVETLWELLLRKVVFQFRLKTISVQSEICDPFISSVWVSGYSVLAPLYLNHDFGFSFRRMVRFWNAKDTYTIGVSPFIALALNLLKWCVFYRESAKSLMLLPSILFFSHLPSGVVSDCAVG